MSSGRSKVPSYIKTLRVLNIPSERPIVVVNLPDGKKGAVVAVYRFPVTPSTGKKYYRYGLSGIETKGMNLAFKKTVSKDDAEAIAIRLGVRISTTRKSSSPSHFKWRLPF